MRIKYLFLITLFCVSMLFLPNVSLPDYTKWGLPEGAKARLGKGTIQEVKLSPDGTLLAVGSSIGVWLYEAHTGEELVLLTGHTESVNSVAFSSDGKTLASGSADSTIRLWEVSTGTHLKTLKGHTGEVTSLCFSPDSRTLASASRNGTIRLWRVAYGTHLKTLKGDSFVIGIAFSGDGRTLVTASKYGSTRIWDSVSGRYIEVLTEDVERVISVAFSNDGKTFTSTSHDSSVNLWDAASGEHLKILKEGTKPVSSVAFSRDGNTLASASEDEIYLWDLTSSTHPKTFIGHKDPIIGLDFSSNGKTLVSASEVEVCLWDATSGKHLKTVKGHTKKVTDIAFSSDGKTLASTSGKEIYLWDATSGTQRKTLIGHTESVNDIAFSSDGKFLAGAIGNEIYLWDTASGKYLQTFIGHTKAVFKVAFSKDSKTLASASTDKTIKLWNAVSGEHFKTVTEAVNDIAFRSNKLAGRSGDKIHLWATPSGEYYGTSTGHWNGTNISFANANWHGKVHLWTLFSGEVSKRTFIPGNRRIKSWPTIVALNDDGKTLASTDVEKIQIHLWDVASRIQYKTFIGHTKEIKSVVFGDGNTLASASEDGTVLLWYGDIQRDWRPKLKKEVIAERTMTSTVVVSANVFNAKGEFGTRLGSGFVLPIYEKGGSMIATNYHVVEHFDNDDEFVLNSSVNLVNRDKTYKIDAIVAKDKENDLAILKIKGHIYAGSRLFFGNSDEVELFTSVSTVGSPRGMEGTPSWGTVTSIREVNSKKRFQIDAAVSKGSSGGPLLNDRGEVIGIIVSGVKEGLDLNFAIPSNYLKELIEKVKEKE